LNFVYRDRDYKGLDGVLLYGIPTAYFVLMLTIMSMEDRTLALLAFLIGLFYIIMALAISAAFSGLGELKKFSNAMLCIASTPFIAAATALHFDGSTVTIIWAIEAVVMVLIGTLLETGSNRVAGIILAVLTGVRVLFLDLGTPNGELLFNQRSATLFFVALMYFIIWIVYYRYIQKMQSGVSPEEMASGRTSSMAAAFFTIFLWITLESHDFMKDYLLLSPDALDASHW
jgi:hypothetical protein